MDELFQEPAVIPDGGGPPHSEPRILSNEVKLLREQVVSLIAALHALVKQQRVLHRAVQSLSKSDGPTPSTETRLGL